RVPAPGARPVLATVLDPLGHGLPDPDQLDVEDERLPRERVVQVEGDRRVVDVRDPRERLLPGCDLDGEHLTDLGLDALRELVPGDVDLELLATYAVRVLGRDAYLALLAHLHPGDRVLESADHHAGADLELDRLAVPGTVEHRPVLEPSGVMHGDGIARLRLTAHGPLLFVGRVHGGPFRAAVASFTGQGTAPIVLKRCGRPCGAARGSGSAGRVRRTSGREPR